jgi:Fe-S oxidoreductase
MNLRDRLPGAAALSEAVAGFSARRALPKWRRDFFRDPSSSLPPCGGGLGRGVKADTSNAELPPSRLASLADLPHKGGGNEASDVVLFADTFNRYFERENLDAALAVLTAGGYRVHLAKPADGSKRPLCCGRTFLSTGCIDEARREAERVLAALEPYLARGVPVIGLEPSCLLTFRDELPALIPGDATRRLAAHSFLFEEFLVREMEAGRLKLPLSPVGTRALLHGHCHQKAFGAMGAVEAALKLVPGLAVETVDSSCCGMAGAFGYGADTAGVSVAMGELSLLPAVRKAAPDTIVVADGTSCRHQIGAETDRRAVHVACVLAESLQTGVQQRLYPSKGGDEVT